MVHRVSKESTGIKVKKDYSESFARVVTSCKSVGGTTTKNAVDQLKFDFEIETATGLDVLTAARHHTSDNGDGNGDSDSAVTRISKW